MQIQHWIKTILIKWFVSEDDWVCEFFPGSGRDTRMWKRANAGVITVIEADTRYINQIIQRFIAKKFSPLPLILHVDIKGGTLNWEELEQTGIIVPPPPKHSYHPDSLKGTNHKNKYSVVSCFSGLDEAFTSLESVTNVIENAIKLLADDGYFIGIIPDSSSLFTKANKQGVEHNGIITISDFELLLPTNCSVQQTFENDLQPHPFTLKRKNEDSKNGMKLYLVHCPTFIRLCAQHGLLLIDMQNLADFYEEHKKIHESTLKKILGTTKVKQGNIQRLSLFTTFVFRKTCVTVSKNEK